MFKKFSIISFLLILGYNYIGGYMKYVPKMYKKTIFDIPYHKLLMEGIKCLVFDLDNTIALIDERVPSKEVKDLFKKLNKDFSIFILSNNHSGKRIKSFALELGVKSINFACKPFTRGLRKISTNNNFAKEEMVIIGDQLVTDIYSGTRFGIKTILVDPLAEKDLWITKFNRIKENMKLRKYRKKNLFERGKYYE